MYFEYGNEEIEYLKNKDKKLCKIINKFGYIKYEVDEDLFSAIVFLIIGQQISTKAQNAIWKRLNFNIKCVTVDSVINASIDFLHSCGISEKKCNYIIDCAMKIKAGEVDLSLIKEKNDEEAIKELTKLKGIGVWTAETLLLFSLMRKNIFSCDDIGLQRGLRRVYHHKKISKKLFEKYRERFSPYCSVASIYLWAAADIQDI